MAPRNPVLVSCTLYQLLVVDLSLLALCVQLSYILSLTYLFWLSVEAAFAQVLAGVSFPYFSV